MSGAIGEFGMRIMAKMLFDIIKMPELKDNSVYEIHIQQDGLDDWYPFPDEMISMWKNMEEGVESGILRRRRK